jgi:hypothetical protein
MTRDLLDQLLSDIIDGCDEPTWQGFVARADSEPQLWRELAEMQRDQALLIRAVFTATASADRVEAPASHEHQAGSAAPSVNLNDAETRTRGQRTLMRLAGGLGWAAAAGLALALFLTHEQRSRFGDSQLPDADSFTDRELVRINSPDDAVREYVMRGRETGQVVGEMPTRLLIESRPSPTGEGFDVVYLRQFMERDHVPALYQPSGRDESGRATLVNYDPQRGSSM